jgi:flagellar hook protein FlgE
MLRSMYSGVSGLRGYQTMIDVVGNNIANVNTIGFKAGQTVFQDLLSQTIQGAGLPAEGGGTNPAQVGLGMRLAGTTTSFGQGGLQNTGRPTDMSIQGDGFFVVRRGGENFFTRAGSFTLDGNGRLATPQGTLVQGWTADEAGVIDPNGPVDDILMPVGTLIDPQVTTDVTVGGNLPANAIDGAVISTSITIYDNNGAGRNLTLQFTRDFGLDDGPPVTEQGWNLMLRGPVGGTLTDLIPDEIPIAFNLTTGQIGSITLPGTVDGVVTTDINGDDNGITFGDGTAGPFDEDQFGTFDVADTITINFGGNEGLTQFSALNSLSAQDQNGSAPGSLQTFTIAQTGVITGVFSNGRTQNIAQIAIANFDNPSGLEKLEGSMYRPTANSGLAAIGQAGLAGRGTLAGGTLEMSNVDLAQEFTNLIVAQRGFQASTRVITASDEVLNDLVNIRR